MILLDNEDFVSLFKFGGINLVKRSFKGTALIAGHRFIHEFKNTSKEPHPSNINFLYLLITYSRIYATNFCEICLLSFST